MSTPQSPPSSDGALVVGAILGAVVYGYTCSQGFMYYSHSLKDPLLERLYVLVLWVMETANTALITHIPYYYLLTHYGNPAVFLSFSWSLVSMVVFTTIISFMVRGAFVGSVWKMNYHHPAPTAALGALSLSNFACGILLAIKCAHINDGNFASVKAYMYLDLASAIFVDVCIAATLCYHLSKQKNEGNVGVSLINRIVVYVVGTGMLTIVVAFATLITYAVMPNKFVFLAPFLLWSKFYSNALLVSLTARQPKSPRMVNLQYTTPLAVSGCDNSRPNPLSTPAVNIRTMPEDPSEEDFNYGSRVELFVAKGYVDREMDNIADENAHEPFVHHNDAMMRFAGDQGAHSI